MTETKIDIKKTKGIPRIADSMCFKFFNSVYLIT